MTCTNYAGAQLPYAGILFGCPPGPEPPGVPRLASGRPNVILNVNSSVYFFFLTFGFFMFLS